MIDFSCGDTGVSSFSIAVVGQLASADPVAVTAPGDTGGIAISLARVPVDTVPPATVASPGSGNYVNPLAVTLVANEPATIYYTTNGQDPTALSPVYTTPIPISAATTLKFFGVDTAGNREAVQSTTYTFDPVLTVILQGAGSINSLIQPPVFTCASPSPSCAAAFTSGTPFTLQATPAARHDFAGWTSQVCSGSDVCSFTLDSATTVTATFTPQPLVRIVGSGTPYNSFGAAWGDVGVDAALRARNLVFDEDLYLALTGAIALTGGYADREFTERTGFTTIHGILTVGTGSLTVDGVAVQ